MLASMQRVHGAMVQVATISLPPNLRCDESEGQQARLVRAAPPQATLFYLDRDRNRAPIKAT